MTDAENLLKDKVSSFKKEGIAIVSAENSSHGLEMAKKIIYAAFLDKTLLLLSGGSTPKTLYETFTKEEKLAPGAIGMIDERAGMPFHPASNELMIKKTGLLSYLKENNIPFYGFLKGKNRFETAKDYEFLLEELFSKYPYSIAILGIGPDGHTAGIAPNRSDFTDPIFDKARENLLVSEFKDSKSMDEGGFGERITLTFKALEKIDLLIILAFSENKKEALEKMFSGSSIEEIPARFYTRPDIAEKTILITDQTI